MTPEIALLKAKSDLFFDHMFFGALLSQLEQVEDPSVQTMATNGRQLRYAPDFIMRQSRAQLLFMVVHEVYHNAAEHHLRRGARNPIRWNMACDYAINLDLVEAKVGTPPAGVLLDARFAGMSAEEIYRILDEEDPNGKRLGKHPDPGGCGGVFDACAPHDQAGIAKARAETQTMVRAAAQAASVKGIGSLPAGIRRIIDRLTKPVIDWRQVLRRFVDESNTRDFSWTRPNRRFLSRRLITPGQFSEAISHLVVAIDTSGSIDTKALTAFCSEVNGAFGDGMIDQVTVVYADAEVNHVEEFYAGDEVAMVPVGGGGTAFSDTFEWIAKNCPSASAVIYFTDLMVWDFGKPPATPVLWAVYGPSSSFDDLAAKTPFGEAISLAEHLEVGA
ncbi:MAG: VWA-like domain-containing protein [Rhizobiaceae bacterium]